jgi:hypothetical protein
MEEPQPRAGEVRIRLAFSVVGGPRLEIAGTISQSKNL